jgi:hypothetical protein
MRDWSLQPFQRALERFYGLEPAPNVDDFVRIGEEGEREALVVRYHEGEDVLEVQLRLPRAATELELQLRWSGASDARRRRPRVPSDVLAQVVEGVSHFVLLGERARMELPITELELELQAEVDKFVFFGWPFELCYESRQLHARLFSSTRYLDGPGTERGARYRLANRLAAKYTDALLRRTPRAQVKCQLRRFFHAGQTDKIRMAQAA